MSYLVYSKKCGCQLNMGRVPFKYLGITTDANEYGKNGELIKARDEDPIGTTGEVNYWSYCNQHTQEMLKEIYDEEGKNDHP